MLFNSLPENAPGSALLIICMAATSAGNSLTDPEPTAPDVLSCHAKILEQYQYRVYDGRRGGG